MSVEALLQLHDDVVMVLSQKAVQLEEQLLKLGGDVGGGWRGRGSAIKGRKVPAKYRDREGNAWAGRGVQPRLAKLKAGAKLEDFAVQEASRTASLEKSNEAPMQEVSRDVCPPLALV